MYVNILVAALLLLAYSAPYIDPSKILFPAFLGLAYPFLLLANLVFAFFWAIRFKKEILISLLVILLGWNHLMNYLPMNLGSKNNNSENIKAQHFKVMSYNVRNFDLYNWSKKDDSRENIYKLINGESPAILCVQEFYTTNRIGYRERDVRRKLGSYPHYSIYYGIRSGPNTGVGIATFSAYPILKTSRIPFDNSLNQAVYTDLLIQNDTLRVFNIHLQSIRFGQDSYNFLDTMSLKYSNRQLREAKKIGIYLKDAFIQRAAQARIIQNYLKESPYPVLVMGDFNDTPLSFAYRKISRGLHDAFRRVGKGLGNTYAGDLPSFRIDFILYSEELEASRFSRIKSEFSDHFPIIAHLGWSADPISE